MKRCIFCDHVIGAKDGGRPRAREHIFASWVLREFGIQKDEISYSRFESEAGATTTLQLTEQTRFRSHSFDSFLLGSVCNLCNNERLNALEGEVAPALKGLIPGVSASIPSSHSTAFALWGLKTAFVLTSFLGPSSWEGTAAPRAACNRTAIASPQRRGGVSSPVAALADVLLSLKFVGRSSA